MGGTRTAERATTRSAREGVRARLPRDQELIERVSWLINLRWIAAAGILSGAWIARNLARLEVPDGKLVMIGLGLLAYNVALGWWVAKLRRTSAKVETFRLCAHAQILLDWAALALLAHWTGGLESPVLPFFVFHGIIASVLLGFRAAAVHAVIGVLVVVVLAGLEHGGVIDRLPIRMLREPQASPTLFVSVTLFFFATTVLGSVYLAGTLSRKLASRTQQLVELSASLDAAYRRDRTLYDITKAVSSNLDIKRVLGTVVEKAATAMGAKACSVRMLGDDGRTLELGAAFGLSEEYLAKGRVDVEAAELDRQVLGGEVVLLEDVSTERAFQYREAAALEGLRSLVSVPVIVRDKPLGVLRVYSGEVRRFTDAEVAFVSVLAGEVGGAIHNAWMYRDLQALEASKSKFVFTVAHDLKAPVDSVEVQFGALRGGYVGALTERQQKLVDGCIAQLAALRTLIQDLLALGSLQGRMPDAERSQVSLDGVLRRVAERMKPRADSRSIQVDVSLPSDGVSISANEEDMERLVGNLVENAVKYTNEGGKVSVELTAASDRVRLVTSDTGIGIPPDALPHIFEEFYRAPNAKSSNLEGTGLGLSLVKRIVDLYRGDISVESEPGRGTTIVVTFQGLGTGG